MRGGAGYDLRPTLLANMRLLRVASAFARPGVRQAVRQLSTPPAQVGFTPRMFAGGMVGAAVVGLGIGAMLQTHLGSKDGSKKAEKKNRSSVDKDSRRRSTVYEDVADIADELPRPALIKDAEREELEAIYEFVSCLASGGSATVWRAVERSTGRPVAIKVIDKKLLPPSLLNMEVYSMQRCAGHPNTVQLLAAYELEPDEANPNGEWHLVMELAEGGELFERLLMHGAYSEKVASQLMRQAAKAIYHLHSCGIAHRDIKPENMVLMSKEPDAQLKLIDFGAAVVLEEDEQVPPPSRHTVTSCRGG